MIGDFSLRGTLLVLRAGAGRAVTRLPSGLAFSGGEDEPRTDRSTIGGDRSPPILRAALGVRSGPGRLRTFCRQGWAN